MQARGTGKMRRHREKSRIFVSENSCPQNQNGVYYRYR